MLVADSTGIVQSANKAAIALTGITSGEIGHLPFWELLHPDDQDRVRSAFLEQRNNCPAFLTLEFRLARSEAAATAMHWGLHPAPSLLPDCTSTFITPDSRFAADRRRTFLSNAGHELRNPLSSILAFAEALQEGVHGPLSAQQAASMQAIRDNVHRQIELLNQFIDLGHLEVGALTPTPSSSALSPIVESAVARVQDLARGRSIQIQTTIHPAGIEVVADARRLGQIVSEMLSTGVISCPVGGQLRLEISCAQDGASLEACLVGGLDNHEFVLGSHLGGTDQTSLNALARVRKLRPIGYALLEALVKMHRGTLSYQSSPNGGMGIRVHLALADSTATEASAPLPQQVAAPAPPVARSDGSPLILLADDQPALSAITRDYLESIGMRVDVAFDGQEALQKATALLPDLIMMDVQMPVMDGLEAIRQIRQSSEPRLREVPIICLSGLAVAGDMEKCLAAGATSYLAKPFGVQQLQRAIRSFLPLP